MTGSHALDHSARLPLIEITARTHSTSSESDCPKLTHWFPVTLGVGCCAGRQGGGRCPLASQDVSRFPGLRRIRVSRWHVHLQCRCASTPPTLVRANTPGPRYASAQGRPGRTFTHGARFGLLELLRAWSLRRTARGQPLVHIHGTPPDAVGANLIFRWKAGVSRGDPPQGCVADAEVFGQLTRA